ncbi:hypothetical protein JCM11491_000262 [Sporobolomyces phaffii]
MPRPTTRHQPAHHHSTAMAATFSTASSAAADDFGGLSLASASGSGSSPRSPSSSASPSPAPPSALGRSRASSSTSSHSAAGPKRRERQTRLQEHLRTVKPGSTTAHVRATKPASMSTSTTGSKTLPAAMAAARTVAPLPEATYPSVEPSPTSSRPKRKAAQKVVMHELELDSDRDSRDGDGALRADDSEDAHLSEDEEAAASWRKPAGRRARGRKAPRAVPREREISSLSTVSAGIDVEGMDDDEVQNRLEQEKQELMERLAQHGINPQADVLDRALVTLSSSNEKLTVESFLRALSALDSRSPHAPLLPLPVPPPSLSVQVPAKRVSFSALESPSTPSSSHSSLHPSPPSKPVSLPVSTPLAPPNALLPAFASNGHVSPPTAVPVPSTPASLAGPPLPSPAGPAPSTLFGSSLPGMGRIALTRRHTYLGVPSASDPAPTLLPAFEPVRQPVSSGGPFSLSSSPHVKSVPVPGSRSSVSKLQSWLDDDDSEEEDPRAKPRPNGRAEKEKTEAAPLPKEKRSTDGDEEMEIRVGGKTVKVLRKRRLEDDTPDEDGEERRAESAAIAVTVPSSSSKGKGKQRAVECVCGDAVSTDESSHGTVSCGRCETLFHLACLKVHSRRHLPLEWSCERCQTTTTTKAAPLETPLKRPRTGPEMTPPMSNEPTFVTGSFSPIPRGNFAACPDVALAPSPTSSPKQRSFAAVPTSPVVSSATKVAIPATPHFGKDSDPRSDYSPCSPLFNRKSRSRLVSGVFDSAPFGDDWAAADPAPVRGGGGGGVGNLFDSHHPFGDALNPNDWHDVTMTPSRGLASSTAGGGVGWETPFASRSRQPSALLHHPHSAVAHHRTPSQDLFSGSALDYVQGGRHTAPAQMFAQRLFGGSGGGEDPASPSRTSTTTTTTTTGPPGGGGLKRAYRHGRNPSSSYILPPHAFSSSSSSSASASIFAHLPPTPQSGSTYLKPSLAFSAFPPSPSRTPSGGLASAAMKTSMSAPGMMRTGSNGLGIGYAGDDDNDDDNDNDHDLDHDREAETASSSHFDDLLL